LLRGQKYAKAYKLEIVKEHLNNHKSFLELKEKYGFICLLDEQYYHQIYQFDVQYQKIKRLWNMRLNTIVIIFA